MADTLEIIVGTYEEFLLGYKIKSDADDTESTLSVTFSTRSHTASIRAIAIGASYLISSGADDKIIIYDMKTRKEVNILMNHEGTVNAVCFTPDNTHILTGGDDGRIVVTRVGTWQIGADWKKAHNGSAVTHISCHPSGKLALSLGSDLTMKTWNLITGRCAYTINLKSRPNLGRTADCIQWSPNGDHFILTGLRVIEIFSIETAKTIKEISVESKPISVCWLTDTEFLVGLENGKMLMTSIEENTVEKFFEAHDKRVKAMAFLNKILVTTSSSGEIIAWNVNLKKNKIKKIAGINIGCRPTCIALLDLTQFNKDYKLLQDELTETTENLTDEVEVELKKNTKIQNVGEVVVEFEEDDHKNSENVQTSKSNKKRKIKLDDIDIKNTQKSKIRNETVELIEIAEKKKKKNSVVTTDQKKINKKSKAKQGTLNKINRNENSLNNQSRKQDNLILINKNIKEIIKKKKKSRN